MIEDIASQSGVVFGIQHDWRDPISGVHVSQGSAETLVSRDGITNYRSLAYSLITVSAKNYENRLICVEVISMSFFETQCRTFLTAFKNTLSPSFFSIYVPYSSIEEADKPSVRRQWRRNHVTGTDRHAGFFILNTSQTTQCQL